MINQNKFTNLSSEKLYRRKKVLKGVIIGLGIVYLAVIVIMIYIFFTKGFRNFSIAILMPVFAFLATLMPIYAYLSSTNKELKSRSSNNY